MDAVIEKWEEILQTVKSDISALSRTELDKVQARVVPLLDKMQVEKTA